MKKKKKWYHIVLIVLASFFGVLVLAYGGYRIVNRIILNDYYSIKTDMRDNPGLNDGYIPQGTQYLADKDIYLTSGYMGDGSASRIYSVDKDNQVHHCSIKNSDGTDCTNHFGGITCIGNYIYVSSGEKLAMIRLNDVLSNDEATIVKKISVGCTASFVFANNIVTNENSAAATLYVGEFNNSKEYVTEHNYTDSEGNETHAIILRYSLAEVKGIPLLFKTAEYAIRDEIQGCCVTANGKIVLSSSYGIRYSHFYIYDAPEKQDTKDGQTPVYYLDSRYLTKDLQAPPMSEDLDYYDGKVLYCTEAASNKYFYGKLLFDNKIYGLAID